MKKQTFDKTSGHKLSGVYNEIEFFFNLLEIFCCSCSDIPLLLAAHVISSASSGAKGILFRQVVLSYFRQQAR